MSATITRHSDSDVARSTPAAGLRVGYLIQDFAPEVGAGPARVLEMAQHWQAHGDDVTVITAMPNRRIPGRGDGRIDSRYRGKFFINENWEGITTLRSWLYTSSQRGFVRTLLNNASFMVTSLLHGVLRRPKLDVLIVSSPPFFPLVSGVGLSRILGVPLVIELRDLWPDYLEQMGMVRSRVALRAMFALERWLLARAERVVVVTESFRERVIGKGVAADRIDVVPNGVDLTRYYASNEPVPLASLEKAPGEFIAGYLGTFGRGQELAGVVEAAGIVAKIEPRIRFVLAGDGPDRAAVMSAIESHGATNVLVCPPIPRDQTRAFYNACDVCLVPLAPIPVFQETIPSKIFEVMACERPVIGSFLGEGARIVNQSGGGTHVRPGDPRALADAVLAMHATPEQQRLSMGRRGRVYVREHYDREKLAAGYQGSLIRLTERQRVRKPKPIAPTEPVRSIVFLNRFYWPDDSATAQMLTDLCEDLAQSGWNVTVIASNMAYRGGGAPLPLREQRNGVTIRRVRSTGLASRGLPGRALDYVAYVVGAFGRLMTAGRWDVIGVMSDPPLMVAVAVLAGRIRRTPTVYWVQDLFPQIAARLGVLREGGLLYRFAHRIALWAHARCDLVITLGESMMRSTIGAGTVPERTAVVHNWADAAAIHPVPSEMNPFRAAQGLEGKFVVLYSGNAGRAHIFGSVIGAAKALKDDPDFLFLFIGSGPRMGELQRAAEEGNGNYRFLPLLPRDEIRYSLPAANVSLVTEDPTITGLLMPSKTYGILASGRPLLFIGAPTSDIAKLVRRHDCGIVLDPTDTEGLVSALRLLRADPAYAEALGARARDAAERLYDRRHATATWEAKVNELVSRSTDAKAVNVRQSRA